MINFELLNAIRLAGLTQRKFAELVGDDASIVSRAIAGLWNLDDARRTRYAQVLKCSVDELFPENKG